MMVIHRILCTYLIALTSFSHSKIMYHLWCIVFYSQLLTLVILPWYWDLTHHDYYLCWKQLPNHMNLYNFTQVIYLTTQHICYLCFQVHSSTQVSIVVLPARRELINLQANKHCVCLVHQTPAPRVHLR